MFLGGLIFLQIGCQEKPIKNSINFKVPEKKQLKKVEPKKEKGV